VIPPRSGCSPPWSATRTTACGSSARSGAPPGPRTATSPAILHGLAASLGLDAARLAERANAPDTRVHYDSLTQEAIDRGVFGVPTYVLNGEMFWGQDRLDFLARALAQ